MKVVSDDELVIDFNSQHRLLTSIVSVRLKVCVLHKLNISFPLNC